MSDEAMWFKSSYSSSQGDDCVEVSTSHADVVHVRDSKNRHRPHLTLTSDAWRSFLSRTTA
ncbi:DUF397 domain-containing protein [Streptomyces sp. ST2-7A]|uniref:DUF397 domain-containing protein n=1 Tax=Streptomyces sp. ST2-7A TaxID=2907214 RepID=UPI001F3A2CB3|nr:DUF397 domain-containing protein [Streptomyces sp. ST2-7A]MCE7082091.1 DUF397 domain-containing protein [Streptomyces sp. ST2-7A]